MLKLRAPKKWGRSSEGERWNRTPEVAGSNPAASTKFLPKNLQISPDLENQPEFSVVDAQLALKFVKLFTVLPVTVRIRAEIEQQMKRR